MTSQKISENYEALALPQSAGPASSLTSLLESIVAHLGAAVMQRAPSDDAIIAEHVEASYGLALQAYRIARAEAV